MTILLRMCSPAESTRSGAIVGTGQEIRGKQVYFKILEWTIEPILYRLDVRRIDDYFRTVVHVGRARRDSESTSTARGISSEQLVRARLCFWWTNYISMISGSHRRIRVSS